MSAFGRVSALVALMVVAMGAMTGCGRSEPENKPNVLLITLDTTRADRMGCYGADRPNTPNFDRLAAEGAKFDLAIAQASVTPVSHASILTGRNPQGHGLRVMHAAGAFRLPTDVPTITSVLSESGWNTGAFLSSFTVSEHFGLDAGFDHFDNGLQEQAEEIMKPTEGGRFGWDVKANQRRSDDTTQRAVEWIQRTEGPFFAWIHYWDPHDGGLLPPEQFLRSTVPPGLEGDDLRRAIYDAEVRFVDLQFGRLMQALQASGRYDDTMVIVVADHGQGLGDHGWWHHRILYQEQILVPLLVKLPGSADSDTPRGVVVDDLVRTIDIAPTVFELLGKELPAGTEGASLLGLMRGEADPGRVAYADQLNLFDLNAALVDRRPNDGLLYCAMDASWKLIYRPLFPERSELYHLAEDPKEATNLFDPEHEHARRLLTYLENSGGFVDKPFGESVDEETLERLRSLGYAGR